MTTPAAKIVTTEAAKQWRLRCAVQGYRVAIVQYHTGIIDGGTVEKLEKLRARGADAILGIVVDYNYPAPVIARRASLVASLMQITCVTSVPASDCADLIRGLAPDVTLPAADTADREESAAARAATDPRVSVPAAPGGNDFPRTPSEPSIEARAESAAEAQELPGLKGLPAAANSARAALVMRPEPQPTSTSVGLPEAFSPVSDVQHSVRNAIG